MYTAKLFHKTCIFLHPDPGTLDRPTQIPGEASGVSYRASFGHLITLPGNKKGATNLLCTNQLPDGQWQI